MNWKTAILAAAALFEIFDLIKKFLETTSKSVSEYILTFLRACVIIALLYFAITEFNDSESQSNVDAKRGDFGEQKDVLHRDYLVFVMGERTRESGDLIGDSHEAVTPMHVSSENSQFQFNVVLRDSKGDTYATITGRTWEITVPAGIEYQNNDSAFEIRTGGRVVFQMLMRKDTVIISGMLCSEQGACNFGSPSEGFRVFEPNTGNRRFSLPSDFILQPIFKYPRNRKNLGKMVTADPGELMMRERK